VSSGSSTRHPRAHRPCQGRVGVGAPCNIRTLFRKLGRHSGSWNRPVYVEAARSKEWSVSVLKYSELMEVASREGLPQLPPESLRAITDFTKRRIEERLNSDRNEAIRFGAFSYLIEVLRAWPDAGDLAQKGAVGIAGVFLSRNPAPELGSLDEKTLYHFADVIRANGYDWEGLLIAYLDPDAARLDRLRQNLKLSPTERWRRHQKLIPQIVRARRV